MIYVYFPLTKSGRFCLSGRFQLRLESPEVGHPDLLYSAG